MKVGILTFSRARSSFGAVLQCLALQEAIKRLGHDAWVIDYRRPKHEAVVKVFDLKVWFRSVLSLKRTAITYLLRYPARRKRSQLLGRFESTYYNRTNPCGCKTIPRDFDAYVIGSDQLWNPGLFSGYVDPVYTGNFARREGSKLFGFAISGRLSLVDMVGERGLREIVSRFDALSLREPILAKVIGSLSESKPHVCCDPTLLLDMDFWDQFASDKYKGKDYVLMFQVQGSKKVLKEKAKALATSLHCDMMVIGGKAYSIEDFLSAIKYARYVVTSSFHGTAFSLIFERPMYAVKFGLGGDERYAYLLHTIGADQMCVDKDFNPIPIEVNYKPIKKNLNAYKEQSLKFLSKLSEKV